MHEVTIIKNDYFCRNFKVKVPWFIFAIVDDSGIISNFENCFQTTERLNTLK